MTITQLYASAPRRAEAVWRVEGWDRQGRRAFELEALRQAGLTRLARKEIEARLPGPLGRIHEREAAEREQLCALLRGGSS